MAGEWRNATLDQLGRIVTGKTPPSSRKEYYGGSIPFVTPTDFDGRRTINDTGRYVTDHGADFVAGSRLPSLAVMVSCIGSDMGKAAIAGRGCVTNQQINSIVVNADNDAVFVYYNLSTRKAEIRAAAGGSAQPILNKTAFGQLDILLPPLSEQRAIAHILGTLDDKIEVNRRMSATLEAMARALFKSWFVDFEPVRAKAEGRDPGLPPHLAALFPARLVETEHGEIPEGWQAWGLGQIATHHRATLSPSAEPDRVFEHYSIPAHDVGREPALDRSEAIKSNKTVVPDGAVLLSKLNPEISRVWLPKPKGEAPQIASTEFLCFTPEKPAGRALLYCIFNDAAFRTEMEAMVTGTSKSHQRISPSALLQFEAVVGSNKVFRGFEEKAWPMLDRTLSSREETRTLAALRDALLPKLISGELRVKDAERALASAPV